MKLRKVGEWERVREEGREKNQDDATDGHSLELTVGLGRGEESAFCVLPEPRETRRYCELCQSA